jgi:hypothetical protein
VIQTHQPPIVPSIFEKRETCAKFLDANLIRVALEHQDAGELACLYHDAFGQKCILSEVLKECVKKKDARDGSSLADLCPTRRVAPCRWLVGITLPKNKGHALFSKSWA